MFNKNTFFLLLGFLFLSAQVAAQEPDWTTYKSVLKHVKSGKKDGVSLMVVDYQGIINDGSLEKAYQDLSTFKLAQLTGRQEKLAFYINAYNLLAMKMVADHWPIGSIKTVGNFFRPVWDKPAGKLDGETVTLGQIEHKILRPMGEPRIHLAIVCASVSCPDLRNEPYTATQLDHQLDDQARKFLRNQEKGLKIEKKTIRVSRIFDWFEDDFQVYDGVKSFIKHYRNDLPDLKIEANLPYNWDVNN